MAKTFGTVHKCKSKDCGLEFSLVILHRPTTNFTFAMACPMCRADLDQIHSIQFEIEMPDREKHEATVTVRRRPLEVAQLQDARGVMTEDMVVALREVAVRVPTERLEALRGDMNRILCDASRGIDAVEPNDPRAF
jgi:hypothetical protein